jgi:hypothetical protein
MRELLIAVVCALSISLSFQTLSPKVERDVKKTVRAVKELNGKLDSLVLQRDLLLMQLKRLRMQHRESKQNVMQTETNI